ncbi:HD-GYP domain-containing protein [Cellulosilyticum sp. I15G10I2]|uniref:HD-GYP domain-containing protein n=1 Tax=Cellulosilyticum sp. I15G10I2 TaxID=1892843 RepID=UPI00085C2AC5|nr:HD-GYP domain-containing protein [Cellulosilyticum sp. I15G10I2]
MQKLTLPLFECLPGMIVAESIRNMNNGVVYVSEHQELTVDIIENLRNFNCMEVSIYVNSWDTVWKIPKETFESYEGCTDTVKPLLQQIASGQNVDIESFKSIKEDILSTFKDNFKIVGCINSFKFADKYTYTHSINVALLSMLIGKWMKYGDNMIESLLLAGLLHDIGKMKIDAAILNKPEKLSESEFEEIKKHPRYAYELLQYRHDISIDVKVGILMHHERIDGSGYPYAVYNENINDIAKILAVADVYDAMMSERPYKKKHSPFDVMQLMQEGAFGKLDTKILLTFLTNVANYYVGVYVLLSTGEIGQVVAINPTCVYRPIIKVKDKYIDLFTEKAIDIIEVT